MIGDRIVGGETPKTRGMRKNPALDYQQREYRDEDYGENFFVDLSKYGEA